MGNGLWDFHREREAFGSSGGPVADGLNGGASIKGRVYLDRLEMVGIEAQIVCGSHPFRIERSCPARGRKRACSEKDRRQGHVESISGWRQIQPLLQVVTKSVATSLSSNRIGMTWRAEQTCERNQESQACPLAHLFP